MAEKSKGIFRTFFSSILDVRQYVSLNEIKQDTKMVANTFKEVFNTKINVDTTPSTDETFEQALLRLNITEVDLQKKVKLSRYYSIFYFIFSLAFFGYSIYIFFLSHILAGIATLALGIFLLSYALRESITHMQMKKRNFNLTIKNLLPFAPKNKG